MSTDPPQLTAVMDAVVGVFGAPLCSMTLFREDMAYLHKTAGEMSAPVMTMLGENHAMPLKVRWMECEACNPLGQSHGVGYLQQMIHLSPWKLLPFDLNVCLVPCNLSLMILP